MPVIMMTSVDTLYEVTSQDTNPVNRLGAPRIEASFNGLTQMELQNSTVNAQQREHAEHTFQQQQKYLSDAAHVAVNIFNPVTTASLRFRATTKLTAITGKTQPFDSDSESSGLAYTLALALTWGNKKNIFDAHSVDHNTLSRTPIFATGSVPIDCYVKPIGHLYNKIRYACEYMERQYAAASTLTTPSTTPFHILIPKGNITEYENNTALKERVESLGGIVTGIGHVSEALHCIVGDAFDGGIFSHANHGFAGLHAISYEQRHLFMGRESLVNELYQKSQSALEQSYILNVTGVSGSGKSSAVMAGLIPALLTQNITQNTVSTQVSRLEFNPHWALIRPHQYHCIDDVLTTLLSHFCDDSALLAQWLRLKDTPAVMATSIQHYLDTCNDKQQYNNNLWVIDQYEEIFTHSQIDQSIAHSLFPLLSILAEKLPVLIITILRTEYLGALGGQASIDVQLPRRIQTKEIEHIITLQLQYHRLSTESAKNDSSHREHQQHLDHRINNAATGKPLTTVSYLLQQMHQQMIAEDASATLLTHQHYDAVEGIDGVMTQQAELAINDGLNHIPTEQQHAALNGFFEAFIGIDNEHQPIAKTLDNTHIQYYPKGVSHIIHAFMSKGLIIDCGRGHTPKIKLAHDTLLPSIPCTGKQVPWQRLVEWFNNNTAFLLWRQEIEPLWIQWLTKQQEKTYLLTQSATLKQDKISAFSEQSHHTLLRTYLQQSHAKKHKQQRLPWIMGCLICIIVGFSVWHQYFRISSTYVAFISERYGIPMGVTPLNTQERQARQFHFKLTYKAGRLLSLSRHNSQGALKNDVNRDNAARWQYHYAANGNLLTEESYAQNGKALLNKTYEFTPAKNIAHVRFKHHGTQTSIGDITYQAATFEGQSNTKSQITQHKLEFNTQGYIHKRLFFNSHEHAVKDSSGAYGLEYFYNEQGLIIRLQYIDNNGDTVSLNGIHARQFTRDEHGNIASKSWVNKQGKLVINAQGYARTTTTYDRYGNLLEKHYLENDNDATVHNHGFSRATARYDQHGNQIEQQFLDRDGNATLHKWGFARVTLQYDDKGNVTEWRYFDANNQPTLRNQRFARIHFAYDDLGNKVEERYFGLHDKPVRHHQGYARFTALYDTHGNQLEEAYFDIDDTPILNKKGYARVVSRYDSKNNRIYRGYFGIHQQAISNQYGYAFYRAQFDEKGNRTDVYFYNSDEQLTLNTYDFAHISTQYNDQGQAIDIRYYDTQQQPTLHSDGIARTSLQYNAQGRIIEVNYFNTTGQPTLRSNNYARITFVYDDRGNRIEEHYFNTHKKPHLQRNGYAKKAITYNKKNNPIEWKYFGIDGTLKNNNFGYARIIAKYNDQGTVTGSAYYDEKNTFIHGKGSFKRSLKNPS
jgi:YD repeat-containing protein